MCVHVFESLTDGSTVVSLSSVSLALAASSLFRSDRVTFS